MQKADLAIKNGFVVTPHGVIRGDVIVGSGKILSIGVADSIEAEGRVRCKRQVGTARRR